MAGGADEGSGTAVSEAVKLVRKKTGSEKSCTRISKNLEEQMTFWGLQL